MENLKKGDKVAIKVSRGYYENFKLVTTEQALKEQQERRDRLAEKALLDSAKENLNDAISKMNSTELNAIIKLIESVNNKDVEDVINYANFLPIKGA